MTRTWPGKSGVKWSMALIALVAAMVLAGGCRAPGQRKPKSSIRAYVVHHVEHTMSKLASEFEKETGIHVDASYACRGRRGMLRPPGKPRVHQLVMRNCDGDIYITSRRSDLEWARTDGVASSEIIPIGELIPVIEVMKGNPKNIRSVADLGKKGVRVSFAIGCVGGVTETILANSKLTDKIAPNVVLRVPHERPAARSVDGTKADATITWLSTVREVGPEKYDAILIPPEKSLIEPLSLLVLDAGTNKAGAERFARFLQSPKAQKLLTEDGLKREE